jgi:hypothetical protein
VVGISGFLDLIERGHISASAVSVYLRRNGMQGTSFTVGSGKNLNHNDANSNGQFGLRVAHVVCSPTFAGVAGITHLYYNLDS